MFIVRWLMSHPILFAWALAALAIILNWGTKSGVDHAEPKEVAAVHSQQESGATEHGEKGALSSKVEQAVVTDSQSLGTPAQPVVPSAPINELEKPAQPEKPGMDAVQENAQVEEAVEVVAPKQAQIEKVASVEVMSNQEPVVNDEMQVAPSEDQSRTSEAEASVVAQQVADTANEAQPLAHAADLKNMAPDELLKAAREAFWHNQKEEAASIYKRLIELQPDVLDHKGELGNVYWHQDKQKDSAALYAEIAIPLIQKGKSSQVENMLGFIGAFYPEKATEIHQYLMNNQ